MLIGKHWDREAWDDPESNSASSGSCWLPLRYSDFSTDLSSYGLNGSAKFQLLCKPHGRERGPQAVGLRSLALD